MDETDRRQGDGYGGGFWNFLCLALSNLTGSVVNFFVNSQFLAFQDHHHFRKLFFSKLFLQASPFPMAESKKQEEGPKKLGTFDPPKEGKAIRSDRHTTRYYHVMKELERGTMGVVLLVKDQATQKEYAMKCEQRVDNKEDRSRRLKLEILAMLGFRAIRPKHLLQAIEYGVHKDLVFTVMPLIWKTLADLEKYMDGEVFSKSTAIQIAMQSLQGVAAMHQRGLLHGDIKVHLCPFFPAILYTV